MKNTPYPSPTHPRKIPLLWHLQKKEIRPTPYYSYTPSQSTADDRTLSTGERFHHLMEDVGALGASVLSRHADSLPQ
jgi:hypothetical protein